MNILIKLLAFVAIIGFFIAFRTQTSDHQAEFLKGTAFGDGNLPDGFWKGDTDLPKGSWQGKKFNAGAKTGVNVFTANGTTTESAPFKIYNASAVWDKNFTITRIDYNLPENPWYLRPALDEVVETAPGKLLGKIHYRLLFGLSLPIGYFWQER